ncbi:MAG: AtpZ/AtpI family protein [Anaerolineaceae bacterium]
MDQVTSTGKDNKQRIFNLALAVLAGQVGCVTLVLVIAAVLGGIWLDTQFNTKPTFTLVLTFASIPISLVLMFLLAQAAVKKIKTAGTEKKIIDEEENSVGN